MFQRMLRLPIIFADNDMFRQVLLDISCYTTMIKSINRIVK
jgi:hypothetical protein